MYEVQGTWVKNCISGHNVLAKQHPDVVKDRPDLLQRLLIRVSIGALRTEEAPTCVRSAAAIMTEILAHVVNGEVGQGQVLFVVGLEDPKGPEWDVLGPQDGSYVLTSLAPPLPVL